LGVQNLQKVHDLLGGKRGGKKMEKESWTGPHPTSHPPREDGRPKGLFVNKKTDPKLFVSQWRVYWFVQVLGKGATGKRSRGGGLGQGKTIG